MFKKIFIFSFVFIILGACEPDIHKEQLCHKQKIIGKKADVFISLKAFDELAPALKCSEKLNKPILLMFYAEKNVADRNLLWKKLSNDTIVSILNKNFLFVKLQVDAISTNKQNYDLQTKLFATNEQPLFAIINHKMEPILEPVGFAYLNKTRDFVKYLNEGMNK